MSADPCLEKEPRVWAVVPAAGVGQRMGAELPKQYLTIGDKTVLQHTLELLDQASQVYRTLVCAAPNDDHWATISASLGFDTLSANGGATRARSVLNGLEALRSSAADDDWVLVHDAARPCLTVGQLNEFVDQLYDQQVGGLLAMPCKDTLKLARLNPEEQAEVEQTLDRDLVWQAQTPQMFRFGLLYDALTKAIDDDFEITDEASAMERAGFAPRLIAGDASNIKITTPEDLDLATFLLDQQGRLTPI